MQVDSDAQHQRAGGIIIDSTPSGTQVFGQLVRDEEVSPACTAVTLGPCRALSCSAIPSIDLASTGAELEVSSPTAVLHVPFAGGSYSTADAQPLWSSAGEPFTISSPGAEVPAFTFAATSPPTLLLTSPDVTGSLHVPRASDFKLIWSAAEGPNLVTVVDLWWRANNKDYPQVDVACEFPMADGEGAVPAELLALLPAGEWGEISIYPGFLRTQAIGGGWSIYLLASSQAFGPDNALIPRGMSFNID